MLLVNPLGHEYFRNHRAFRVLADRLAQDGFTVLRFDFLGTGDSAEDLETVTLDDWIEDLSLAHAFLRQVVGEAPIHAVARRFGAALTLRALEQGRAGGPFHLDRVTLWDPVLDGSLYLAQLAGMHRHYQEVQAHRGQAAVRDAAGPTHGLRPLLGMSLPEDLARAIEDLDLRPACRGLEVPSLVLDTGPERLADLPSSAEVLVREDSEAWQAEDPNRVFVPLPLLEAILDWSATG